MILAVEQRAEADGAEDAQRIVRDARGRIADETDEEFLQIRRRLGLTGVMVTHDMTEALLSADLIAVMNGGRLLQLGPPHELFTHPGDDFVAALMSSPKRQADRLEALAAGRRN
jgi:osmoprotectant transport system ATP-binding protein